MFKLYSNIGGWKLIDITTTEKELIQSILDYSNQCRLYHYLIIQRENNTDMVVKRIWDEEDLKEYLLEVKERYNPKPIKDKSCMELKKEILDLHDKKKRK